jgi:hypothetical protein
MVFDSSNAVTSHIIPACVKELSLFSGGFDGKNANHIFIHCTWLKLIQTCLIMCSSFLLLVESPTMSVSEILGLYKKQLESAIVCVFC